jgi:hypothetical protein
MVIETTLKNPRLFYSAPRLGFGARSSVAKALAEGTRFDPTD